LGGTIDTILTCTATGEAHAPTLPLNGLSHKAPGTCSGSSTSSPCRESKPSKLVPASVGSGLARRYIDSMKEQVLHPTDAGANLKAIACS